MPRGGDNGLFVRSDDVPGRGSNFCRLMGGYEPLQTSWRSVSWHRPFSLSEWEGAVFSSIVEALVRPTIQARRDFPFGGAKGPQLVRDDPLGNETKVLDQAAQQPFCRPFVPPGLE